MPGPTSCCLSASLDVFSTVCSWLLAPSASPACLATFLLGQLGYLVGEGGRELCFMSSNPLRGLTMGKGRTGVRFAS